MHRRRRASTKGRVQRKCYNTNCRNKLLADEVATQVTPASVTISYSSNMHLINLTNKTNMYEKCQTIGLKMAPHVSFYCQNCTISVIQHMKTSLIAIPQSSFRNRFNIKLFTHYEKPSTQCTNSLLPMIPQFTLKNTTENQRQYNGGIKCAYKLANAGPNKDTKNLKLLEQALPGKIEWPLTITSRSLGRT